MDRWRDAVAGWTADGERIVIWGAGSKGVTFLDTLNSVPDRVRGRRQSAQARPISPGQRGGGRPAGLPERYRPDRVIVMNAVYQTEVTDLLARLGLSPTLVAGLRYRGTEPERQPRCATDDTPPLAPPYDARLPVAGASAVGGA